VLCDRQLAYTELGGAGAVFCQLGDSRLQGQPGRMSPEMNVVVDQAVVFPSRRFRARLSMLARSPIDTWTLRPTVR
jgi:hypothetical protein